MLVSPWLAVQALIMDAHMTWNSLQFPRLTRATLRNHTHNRAMRISMPDVGLIYAHSHRVRLSPITPVNASQGRFRAPPHHVNMTVRDPWRAELLIKPWTML